MRRMLKWVWRLILVFLCLTVLQVFSLRYINPPCTTFMAWNSLMNRSNLRQRLPINLWRTLREISPSLRRAVLAGEDQRFMSHHGFDFDQINYAIKDMIFKKNLRGASTITMQVARTVFLWPQRTWLRKIVEAYYTVLIEILWSKERILEIYLNTVDWGTGIRGIEEASKKYFHISSSHISPSQAAILAAILPNPHRWSPTYPNAEVLRRQKRILRDIEKMSLLK
ncbi:MAG: monofunctional biosynthetic peptidoglycan transglycosylase [Desulfobacteraceae bacterium 4484_190.1]|nr:MAG: monofunctional biosynthetic peptidoglycan transglycosylase [Desulfobacteraceae bacterium 4484_190.1]